MKYYYGNTVTEALQTPPVELTPEEVAQYDKKYRHVFYVKDEHNN